MRLVKDYKRVLLISMSWWAAVFSLAALAVPEILFYFWSIDTDPYLMWRISTGLILFVIVARPIEQTGGAISNWVKIAAVLLLILAVSVGAGSAKTPPQVLGPPTKEQTLAVAVPLIAKHEGLRTSAYLDIVGVPTICYGSTKGVVLGMTKTVKECEALLRVEVERYWAGMRGYYSSDTKLKRLTPHREGAFVSLGYNVGVAGAGNSTAVRRLNAGDIVGSCEALTWFNKAGKRVIRGLVVRRGDEQCLCLKGIQECSA